jgi:hypothetical protein
MHFLAALPGIGMVLRTSYAPKTFHHFADRSVAAAIAKHFNFRGW